MKALRFYAPEDVRLEDVPEPECGPDEVKLRVKNCSTCGTDVKIFYNGHQNLTPPRIIGHEIAGEVVEVGADVNATYGQLGGRRPRPGDRGGAVRRLLRVPARAGWRSARTRPRSATSTTAASPST